MIYIEAIKVKILLILPIALEAGIGAIWKYVVMLQDRKLDSDVTTAGVQAENYLFERISRGLRKQGSQEIVCEFTKNPAYLQQYYLLRSQVMSRSLGWSLPAEEDAYDKASHHMVVRKGNQVIGGGRIIVRSPRLDRALPLETEEFSMIDALPELGLENKKYCELSRFVLLEEFQQSMLSFEMFYRMYKKYSALNIDYGFATMAPSSIRIYRKFCRMLGLNFTFLDQIDLPQKPHYEGVPISVAMFDDVGVKEVAERNYGQLNRLVKV